MKNSYVRYHENSNENGILLMRRSVKLGYVESIKPPAEIKGNVLKTKWQNNEPIQLSGYLTNRLKAYANEIEKANTLFHWIINDEEIEEMLLSQHYTQSISPRFEMLSSRYDEEDEQEIISVDFDAFVNGNVEFDDIWLRISWLSFDDNDASIRFRFSFGIEGYEDVSKNYTKQLVAAELCESLFPESKIISKNDELNNLLCEITEQDKLNMVERIVYFNAPNGGAQFHHDAEKGHLGVVYAQLTGNTFWLALSKTQLLSEIKMFIEKDANLQHITQLIEDEQIATQFIDTLRNENLCEQSLDDLTNAEFEKLLNLSKLFLQQLINNGHGFMVHPGDIMLLPQQSKKNCAWHSVFCLDKDNAGEALSFALKPV